MNGKGNMNSTHIFVLVSAIMLAAPSCLSAEEGLDKHSSKAWDESRKVLGNALALENEKINLPEKAWLRRDQQSVDKEIEALLDDVLEVMEFSELGDARKEYAELKEDIAKLSAEMTELGEKKISASEGSALNPFSREAIENKIEGLKKDIGDKKQEQRDIIKKMKTAYHNMGVEISEDQVRFFLSSVSGENIIDLSSVFYNIKEITAQLQMLSNDMPDETETVKRYYGMYVVMVKALMRAHEKFNIEVDNKYLPRLEELERENEAAAEQTRKLLSMDSSDERRAILEASQETQRITADAIELYRKHLEDMKKRIAEGQENIYDRYKVAENTYRTIKVAAGLAEIMKASVKEFNTLQEMHLPDLMPIKNEALQRKFDEITNEIQQ
jgi:histone H3/H4